MALRQSAGAAQSRGRAMCTGSDGWQPHRERRVEATPAGVDVALGAVVIVAAALVAGLVPVSSTGPRLGLMAAALSLFAAATVDLRAVVVVTVTAYLVFDGFLVNQLGELSWRGAADTRRLAVLGLAAALGLVAGLGYRAAAVFNSRGEGRMIRLLREHGADPFLVNVHGQTPVGLAS